MAVVGPVTITETGPWVCRDIIFDWETLIGGLSAGTTVQYYDGKLIGFASIPGAGGDQPDNLFDAVLNDSDGFDVLNGAGANLSNVATVYKDPEDLASVSMSKLSLSISNAGNVGVRKGQIVVWVW